MTATGVRILAAMVQAYYALVRSTSRTVVLGRRHIQRLHRDRTPRIYAVWHSCAFFAPSLGIYEPARATALVSSRGNGPLFARVIQTLGHDVALGSSSRGGGRAYRQLREHMRAGKPLVITPDGPLGPAFQVSRGILELAARSGASIIPAHFESTRQWRRRTWDEQRIPLPGGTIVASFGRPFVISEVAQGPFVAARLSANSARCRSVCARLGGRTRVRRADTNGGRS